MPDGEEREMGRRNQVSVEIRRRKLWKRDRLTTAQNRSPGELDSHGGPPAKRKEREGQPRKRRVERSKNERELTKRCCFLDPWFPG